MIKLFRNIRKQLLSEGKTSKYLKYAIGEIILVVIGILIALQINNWNENRKSEAVLKNYYTQILQDLAKDYNYINRNIKQLNSNIVLYTEFQENFSKQKSPEALVMSSAKLNYFFIYPKFHTNTIETLQTTGDIKLIQTDIRNKLIDLKNSQDILITTANGNNDNFLKELMHATKLGYSPNTLSLKGDITVQNQLYTDLKIANNFSEIALIVNSAYSLKDITERDQLKGLTTMLASVNSLFTHINKKSGNPYKDIESISNGLIKLETLIESGKTADDIITIVKQQDSADPIYDISEEYINALGYWYINTAKKTNDALKLFKLNTELYPDAYNTYDSYGECLLLLGDKDNAKKAFQKSLELNPDNESAKKALTELTLEE